MEVVVPDVDKLRQRILAEMHELCNVVHLSSIKRCHDLKEMHWLNSIKKDVAYFVAKYLVCQQVKVKHIRPRGLYEEIEFLEWKWEVINMDLVTGLS